MLTKTHDLCEKNWHGFSKRKPYFSELFKSSERVNKYRGVGAVVDKNQLWLSKRLPKRLLGN